MSESATRIDGYKRERALAISGAHEIPRGEVVEVTGPSPEQAVDLGDGSLTFESLVAARDALSQQSEEIGRRLQLYDRAISTWNESDERRVSLSQLATHAPEAASQPAPAPTHPAQSSPQPRPSPVAMPSMIVSIDSFEPDVGPEVTYPVLPMRATPPVRVSREAVAATIRLAVVRPASRTRGRWTLGAGVLLAGLTVWAGHSLSSPSSEATATAQHGLPASIHATAALPGFTPQVLPSPLAAPPSPPTKIYPQPARLSGVTLPSVSISRLDLVWGHMPVRRLRAALKRSISKMTTCFEQVPRSALVFPERLALSVRLRPNGAAAWVKGAEGGGASSTEGCIASALHGTHFPSSTSGLLLNTELIFTPR